jgi:chromate transporter
MSAPETVFETPSQSASFAQMASIFGRFGNITFGGGSATIAVLHREIVSKRRWISEEVFALCYALSRVTPGTNLLAFETGVGWIVRGWVGAVIALVAGSVPCSTLAVLVTFAYESFSQNVLVARAIRGALAATVGLMLVTSIQLLRPHLNKHQFVFPIALALISFIAVWKFSVPPVLDLGAAALLGVFLPSRRST